MRDSCPDSELLAASVESRLTADEEWKVLNHASVCDDCRRELAITRLRSDAVPDPLPDGLRFRLRASGTRRRTRSFRPARVSPAASLAAVLVLSLAAILVVLFYRDDERPFSASSVSIPAIRRLPVLEIPREEERLTRQPAERERDPRRFSRSEEERKRTKPRSEFADELPDPPLPRETRTETAARVFTELTLTDVGGELALHRGQERQPIRGIVTVREGDVLVAEKPSSFHIEGRHAVVLPRDARISVASSAGEQATWLSVRAGHVLVQPDASAASRWILSDGRHVLVVEKTRARFAASREEASLTFAALSDEVSVAPEGGRADTVRAGEEWTPRGVARCARAATYQGQWASGRPRERSAFFAACDAEDLRRGRWTLLEGTLERERSSPFVRAVEKRQRLAATLRLDHRVLWDLDYLVRFRCRTNAKSVRIEIPVPQNQGTLLGELEVVRDATNRWITIELPLRRFQIVGAGRILLSSYDRMESLEFSASPKETHGGRGHLEIDDIQILER